MPATDPLALARRVLHDARPATGGFSGETFSGMWFRQRAYVRLYLRDPGRAAIDLAIMSRFDGKVPLAKVLASSTQPSGGLPAHVVTAAVSGQRADALLDAGLYLPAARALGRQCARVLAVLRAQVMERPGPFLDAGFVLGEWPAHAQSLRAWAGYLAPQLARVDLDPRSLPTFYSALAAADARLSSGGSQHVSLVHSDLNGKNLLIDPNTGRLRAVLDWEYACAGDWTQDVGNLMRGVDEAATSGRAAPSWAAYRQGLVDGVHESLHEEGRLTAGRDHDWLRRARDLDLFALLELAARPVADAAAHRPVVQAREQLRALAAAGAPR